MKAGIDEVREDPELATLAALDAVLLAAEDALLAAWPELTTGEDPLHLAGRAALADRIGRKAATLRRCLQRYAETTRSERHEDKTRADDAFIR